MKSAFRQSFVRDLKKIKDKRIAERIRETIENVDAADDLGAIRNLKKISGTDAYYRIRIGEYRIGHVLSKDTVEFVRCLRRKDLYRYFP
jgi:mRNA interferase RelE/StbE